VPIWYKLGMPKEGGTGLTMMEYRILFDRLG
jgi:hypothetical protein